MSGTFPGNEYDPAAAQRAGLFEGLSRFGAALAEAGRPRIILREGYGPGLLGGLAAGMGGFSQGMREGRRNYQQQAMEDEAMAAQGRFRQAVGNAPDDQLPEDVRALRSALGPNRATFGLLGPQAGMAALAQRLTRAPQAPVSVAPGGTLVNPETGQPIFAAPERPPAPQWVGSPETGYGWAVPPPRGGGMPPMPQSAPPMAPGGAPALPPAYTAPPRQMAPNTPMSGPAPDVPPPNGPVQPVASPAMRELRDGIAAARLAVLNDPNLTPAQRDDALRRIGDFAVAQAPARAASDFAGGQGQGAPRIPGFTPLIPPRNPESYEVIPPDRYGALGLPQPGEGRVWQRNTRTGQVTQAGGSGVTVNTGDNAFDRERGKEIATVINNIEKAGREAPAALRRFESFERSLESFTTGAGAGMALTAGQIAQRLGVPDAVLGGLGISRDQTAQGENIRSIAGQLVLGALAAGTFPTQNFSDGDRAFLERLNPGLQSSPDGNRLLIAAARANAVREAEIGAAWRDWQMRNGGSQESARRFLNERLPEVVNRDLLTNEAQSPLLRQVATTQRAPGTVVGPNGQGSASPPENLPVVRTPDEARRLGPGARFRTPDGRILEVPRT